MAIGTCGSPKMAAIRGWDSFHGPVLHSSALDEAELKGKKVVIIGSGASGVEAAELAVEKGAKQIIVLARDDKWIIPRNTVFDVMLALQPFGREMVSSSVARGRLGLTRLCFAAVQLHSGMARRLSLVAEFLAHRLRTQDHSDIPLPRPQKSLPSQEGPLPGVRCSFALSKLANSLVTALPSSTTSSWHTFVQASSPTSVAIRGPSLRKASSLASVLARVPPATLECSLSRLPTCASFSPSGSDSGAQEIGRAHV